MITYCNKKDHYHVLLTVKANDATFGFLLFISLTICIAASRGLIKMKIIKKKTYI